MTDTDVHVQPKHYKQPIATHRSLKQVLLVVVLFSIAFPALISGGILINAEYRRALTYDGESLGAVTLVYSVKEAKKRAETASRLLLTSLAVQLVFTIALMAYFLRKRVMSPLLQLERSAAGIADGDLRTQVPTLRSDEFGALSNQLERMRGTLGLSIHNLEAAVQERSTELRDVNQELKGTLNQLQHAQSALVQREELAALGSLVAGIAHELNTSIGNGLTVASSLEESTKTIVDSIAAGITKASLEQYLQDMQEGTHLVSSSLEKASELVSSFKQVAVDRTSAQRRRFLLSSLLKEVRVTMLTLMKHSPYRLDIFETKDITLDSYPGPLGQVITNLVNNALLHGFDGRDSGRISISATAFDDWVQIDVEDDGNGIDATHLPHIFDPFFTTKRGDGGNGLGLNIVHNIVTVVLRGNIEVNSTVDKGSIFSVKIPLVAPGDSADERYSYNKSDMKQKKHE